MTPDQLTGLLSRGDRLVGRAIVERTALLAAARAMIPWLERPAHYGPEVGARARAVLEDAIRYAIEPDDGAVSQPYGSQPYGIGPYGVPKQNPRGGR